MQKFGSQYREANASNINNVGLPPSISCKICKKNKSQMQYSKKQLKDLKFMVYKYGNGTTVGDIIRCRDCTGTQTTELRCAYCEVRKSLTEFALNQRNKPDTARCIACQEDAVYVDPDERDQSTGHFGEPVEVGSDQESDTSDDSNIYELDYNGDYMTDSEGGITVPPSESGRSSISSSSKQSSIASRGTKSGLKLTKGNLASLDKKHPGHINYDTSTGYTGSITSTTLGSPAAMHSFAHTYNPQPGQSTASYTSNAGQSEDTNQWQTAGKGSKSGARAHKPGITYTAYDANGVKYERERPPSTVDTMEILSDTLNNTVFDNRPKNKPLSSAKDRFPRVRPMNPLRPRRYPAEDQEVRVLKMEGDSDSDDDDDDFYN